MISPHRDSSCLIVSLALTEESITPGERKKTPSKKIKWTDTDRVDPERRNKGWPNRKEGNKTLGTKRNMREVEER